MSNILVPGRGFMPAGMASASKAVRDYDASLILGRRDDNGEWVVFVERGPNGYPHPVFSLGVSPEPPSRDTILEKLSTHDVRRNGARIVAQIEHLNEQRRLEARYAASEAAGELAEHMEFHTREQRGVSTRKVVLPSEVKSVDSR